MAAVLAVNVLCPNGRRVTVKKDLNTPLLQVSYSTSAENEWMMTWNSTDSGGGVSKARLWSWPPFAKVSHKTLNLKNIYIYIY